ncbi:unnamed protein product [Meganyctiphanes norvegica]|uniref:DNA binding HTH domain-containing protein n=1 Tax=Meganyctiphanes norvegica TaxID=48144 RepID=A0AAV2PKN9_MEGNR
MASWTYNSQLEQPAFLDGYNVVCRNDYSGDRELYWELPFISCKFINVSNNNITMKRAADILGVPQATLYGRYQKYKKMKKEEESSSSKSSSSLALLSDKRSQYLLNLSP